MSIGNLKDNGNKGNNFPFQLGTLQILDAILKAIIASGPNVDREFRITTYKATATVAAAGYSINDIISRTDIIDVSSATIISTLWFNETTGLSIAAPLIGNITPYTPNTAVTVNTIGAFTLTTRTPALLRTTGSGSIAAGARSISVYNAGNANGTCLGITIKPGEQFSYDAGAQGDTLSAFAYDGTGTELVITTVV